MCVYGSSFKVWFSFRIFGGSIFISGSCFVILAFTMRYSQIIVFVIRFIQGFVEVCLYGIYFFSIASKIPPIRLFICWFFFPITSPALFYLYACTSSSTAGRVSASNEFCCVGLGPEIWTSQNCWIFIFRYIIWYANVILVP